MLADSHTLAALCCCRRGMAMSDELRKLFEVNRAFMALEREINAPLMNTFLVVAAWSEGRGTDNPLTISEVARTVELPAAAVSRHLRYLGKRRRRGVAGLGLVETASIEDDARQKMVTLTTEGIALRERLAEVAS